MKIYFTKNGKVNPQYSVLFNQIAADNHKPFIDLVDSVSGQNADSIDWWVSSPASRNTKTSPLFYYCCCIALLQALIGTKEPVPEIVTDSRALKKIIEDYLSKQGVNTRVALGALPVKQRLKDVLRPIQALFGLPFRHLLLFCTARVTRFLCKPLPSGPITLIDTFAMPGYIEKDRNYPGVLNALSEEEKQRVWFAPHLYGFHPWQFLSVLKCLRKAERNFIVKDDFLKFVDYWCLWRHLSRVRKLQIRPSFFCGLDISTLVREELTGFLGICSSYIPLLNYCFAKRLKEADVRLRLVIDWFENQNIDKGWNIGVNRYYPNVESIGYQGFFVYRNYLCMYPSKQEREQKVIPKRVAVIGERLAPTIGKFCSDLDVCVAPAFRFQHLWRKRRYYPKEDKYAILVALPVLESETIGILKLLSSIQGEICEEVSFWLKAHPSVSQLKIQSTFGGLWPERFEFVEGDFGDCVEKSNIVVSSASSVCMETMAKGTPVVVIGNRFGLSEYAIPESITEDIWRLCYSPKEIVSAIRFYRSRSIQKMREHEEVGRRIFEQYFEPVTRESARNFLLLTEQRSHLSYRAF